jgi:hypothetical protein
MLALVAGCPPPAVVDVPASGLRIELTVIDVTPSPSDGKVPVLAVFQQGGAAVQIASSASISCQGVNLPWNGLAYAERVPIVPAGGTMTCVHARSGVNTNITLTVPPRPVVTAPAAGASVTRGASVTINYVAGASAGVRPGASDGATGISGAEQADNGTATVNVTQLKAGPGTVSVSRRIVMTPSTGFASASATYTVSSADTHVTWQ